ncbi:MAG: hypothetical protein VKJ46_15830 [Leptolyngbyaceae bacterium]|nr:hypothetical protein [Leptolyngbyaceae bacterium]
MATAKYRYGVKQWGWEPFIGKLWQRNYYEHIIRDERSRDHLRHYIAENPSLWNQDQLHPQVASQW